MKRIGSILLWSAIAAAFIGPGTVAAAASAGANIGPALLWAILFSGIATFTLQEFAGRLSVATGDDLATVLRRRYPRGFARVATLLLVGGAVLLGCAAYEAGNILGGAAGAMLAIDLSKDVVTGILAGAAGCLLLAGSPQGVARLMAIFVALMGAGFLLVAISLAPAIGPLLSGLVPTPGFADEPAALLAVLALVGTTVVPYNLFLGAALARGQSLDAMRFGLAVSVGLGVLITAAILVVGTALSGEFSFAALGDALAAQLGGWARTGFGMGLLAAGVSSAVTAPLAAALTARGLFGAADDPRWRASGWRFRSVWFAVLVIGLGFGLAAIKPTPAILAAQAFNGVLLPLVALFLLAAMNDHALLGDKANGLAANGFGLLVVGVATMLGLTAVARAAGAVLGFALPDPGLMLPAFALLGVLAGRAITRRAQPSASTLV
ncbi:NRAMP family divalent metal transporter [Erythrobacter sp.]|uniref:NRAMP family divalent metal transporter n=1 Tax=Erythrobacter sp. TaxID=1042 RepID=UPI001B06B4D5|nr:divalent metal cation transporter [Erythrobacter sp.]MBO6527496.1 divalent metal cation transporter [Erythrobacter sp.]MBO6530176.1 divalent metal cation transporter [Erythrobacter sp.]